MDLNDKVAVITGGSSGIGRAVAEALARRGASVILTARGADRLEAAADAIRTTGGRATARPADVRDEAQLQAVFERTVAEHGRLDVLVNAAGVGRMAPLRDGATAHWREMWEVNVLALAVATREALRRFDPETGGHVVHISSMSGHRVPPGDAGFYTATKHAVRAMTEALRRELRATGNRSRVSAVSSGFVDTDFFDGYFEGDAEKIREVRTRYRILDAADVAAAVAYLLEAPDHVAVHDVLLRSNEQPT